MIHFNHPPSSRRAAGFSLVEAVISILIVSVIFAAALNTLAGSRMTQQRIADRLRGANLAQELLCEIMARAYEDPNDTPAFGLEAGETNLLRAQYDDVDDYHKWSQTPPQDENANPLDGFSDWTRTVVVEYVDPLNALAVSASATGVKRITVTALRAGVPMQSAVALKTAASD